MNLVKPSVLRNARLLKALRNVFGRKTFGAKSIIEASLRKDTRGVELSSVVIACCGVAPTMQAVGTYLSKVKGSEFLGLKLTGEYSKDKRTWRYCVEAAGDADLAKQLKAAKAEGRRVTQALESKAKHQAKLAAIPVLAPAEYAIEDVRHALTEYQRRHGPDRTKEMYRGLTELECDLDLLPLEKYSLVVNRCLAFEPVAKPTPAPSTHGEMMRGVLQPSPGMMLESAIKQAPKPKSNQSDLVQRIPGWQRRGESMKPSTMPARVHQAASSGSNIRNAVYSFNDWSPFSILK